MLVWLRLTVCRYVVECLCYLQIGDEGHPSSAVEEILDGPERLKDLDLDAFAVELERQVSHATLCRVSVLHVVQYKAICAVGWLSCVLPMVHVDGS